jgi:hypothetical protein
MLSANCALALRDPLAVMVSHVNVGLKLSATAVPLMPSVPYPPSEDFRPWAGRLG